MIQAQTRKVIKLKELGQGISQKNSLDEIKTGGTHSTKRL